MRAFSERSRGRVLIGTCDSLATPTPLGPFLDVAAQVGGAVGDRAAFEHSKAAGRRAQQLGSHREAAAQFARALRCAGQLPGEERAELLAAFAQEAQMTGRYDESIAARMEAIELCASSVTASARATTSRLSAAR